jgi:hypothetical protein
VCGVCVGVGEGGGRVDIKRRHKTMAHTGEQPLTTHLANGDVDTIARDLTPCLAIGHPRVGHLWRVVRTQEARVVDVFV